VRHWSIASDGMTIISVERPGEEVEIAPVWRREPLAPGWSPAQPDDSDPPFIPYAPMRGVGDRVWSVTQGWADETPGHMPLSEEFAASAGVPSWLRPRRSRLVALADEEPAF
jgi:hypothetical protein